MGTAVIAFLATIAIAIAMLTRQRARARPEKSELTDEPPRPRGHQARIMAKLEPLPEIPTVMDLVREEIEETGVERIPGHEGLPGHVMLKVFKRDHLIRERCSHDSYEFVVRKDVSPPDALEDDVTLFCSRCGAGETDTADPAGESEPTD